MKSTKSETSAPTSDDEHSIDQAILQMPKVEIHVHLVGATRDTELANLVTSKHPN